MMRRCDRYCLTLLTIVVALVACWYLISARFDSATGIVPQASDLVAVAASSPADRSPVSHELIVAGQVYQLSLASFVAREQDGTETLRQLEPAATLYTLMERMNELRGGGEVFPVLTNGDQLPRLLTSAVTIRLPRGMTPQQVAIETKMTADVNKRGS